METVIIMGNQELNEWLSRLDNLMPSDGLLNHSIMDIVCPPRTRKGTNPSFELAYMKAYGRTYLGCRLDKYVIAAHDAEETGRYIEAAQVNATVNYWRSVIEWVDRFGDHH